MGSHTFLTIRKCLLYFGHIHSLDKNYESTVSCSHTLVLFVAVVTNNKNRWARLSQEKLDSKDIDVFFETQRRQFRNVTEN